MINSLMTIYDLISSRAMMDTSCLNHDSAYSSCTAWLSLSSSPSSGQFLQCVSLLWSIGLLPCQPVVFVSFCVPCDFLRLTVAHFWTMWSRSLSRVLQKVDRRARWRECERYWASARPSMYGRRVRALGRGTVGSVHYQCLSYLL